MFWDNFYNACISRGIKPNPLAKELNIASGSMTSWKNGKIPNGETLLKISEYLGVSVDYLLGRTDKPNNIQSTKQRDQVTTELLRVFENLSFKDKISVLNYALNIENPSPQIVQTKAPDKVEESKTQWRKTARTFDGRYESRLATPEEVEKLRQMADEPEPDF